ncbi:hypothetical protein EDB92DRAFT_1842383 [Lactarius akahatsu]|uniref:Pinin/SDK/MemA protein domain-containing protein n=1 Tax=Lactarius akahatsu TaxID=416441 RepID=A0AAD4QDL2_9AGAM|nr:hypothetical protein EDB92DRAFT_1842383 [Lactarius akahatsu]
MSTDEQNQALSKDEPIDTDAIMQDNQPTQATVAAAAAPKKRPRLDLTVEPRERKRGKSMFGLLVGTLNKAKTEDEARNASEAAKKRQLIDKRLQDKLRKETDTVRRAEEAKKDKHIANRKEEETQLKNSIHRLRLPPPSQKLTLEPTRSHPPPLYYLPVVLTSSQEVFIAKRKVEATETSKKEWSTFLSERDAAINEIKEIRQRVVEEEARKQAEREAAKADEITKPDPAPTSEQTESSKLEPSPSEAKMDLDESPVEERQGSVTKQDSSRSDESERKDDPTTIQADDDDAVEY